MIRLPQMLRLLLTKLLPPLLLPRPKPPKTPQLPPLLPLRKKPLKMQPLRHWQMVLVLEKQ
jgi:hypothetical protein